MSLSAVHSTFGRRPGQSFFFLVDRKKDMIDTGADELRDWINAPVAAKYQRLDRVIELDVFPRNAAGKTLKREQRAPFCEGRGATI